MPNKWDHKDLPEAVATSGSIRQVIKKLGLVPAGGNYQTINSEIKIQGLDISHFHGQVWNKGRHVICNPAKPLEELLTINSTAKSHSLKNRLIAVGIFEHKCYSCNLYEWLGRPIAIELEHINGIHSDNRIENLTILCPNCHAQTDTYRGKNIKPR